MKYYCTIFALIFTLSNITAQQALDIDVKQNKEIEALNKKVAELEKIIKSFENSTDDLEKEKRQNRRKFSDLEQTITQLQNQVKELHSNQKTNHQTIAAVKFSGSGITYLETQVLFNGFLEELTKASDNSLMDQENINEKIRGLEIVTTGCISDECLQVGLGALGVQQLLAGSISYTKAIFSVKVQKLDATKSKPTKYSFRYKGEVDGFITELSILAWEIMGKEPPGRLTRKRKPNLK